MKSTAIGSRSRGLVIAKWQRASMPGSVHEISLDSSKFEDDASMGFATE